MKIRKSSWHYRLQRVWGFAEPKNLCAYFWKTVWSALLFPLLLAGAVGVLTVMAYPVWLHFASGHYFPLGLASFLLWVCAGGFAREMYKDELRYYRLHQDARDAHEFFSPIKSWNKPLLPNVHVERPQSINVAAEFIRAKKQKVCPLLDYTNE